MFKVDLKTAGRCALYTYCYIATIRTFTWLILQCCFLSLLQLFDRQTDNSDNKQELKDKLHRIYYWMRVFGSIQRASGPAGVFYYSVAFSVLATYFAANAVSRGQLFNYLKDNHLASYLENVEIESEKISRKIDAILRDLISSNEVLTSALSYTEDMTKSIDNSSFTQYINLDNQRFPYHFKNRETVHLSTQQDRARQERARGDTFDTDAEINVILALQRQLNFLMKLTENKERIWPSNRNIEWADKMKKFWNSIYFKTFIFHWLLGQSCCILGERAAINAIKSHKLFQDTDSQFHQSDLYVCSEAHVLVFWCVYFFISPLTLLITSIMDQLEHLNEMNSKMQMVIENVSRFENWQNKVDPSIRSNYKLLQRAERDLMFECDKDSIEMYISFHMFRGEIKSSMLIAQCAASQNATFILIGSLPILIFIRDIRTDDFAALLIMSFLFIASINGSFALCAVLHSLCVRLSRQIWSYIAVVEDYNINSTNKSQIQKITGDKLGIFSAGLFARRTNRAKLGLSSYISRNMDFHYYSRSFLTPHTMLLWRRLVERQELIEEDFTCKLFGIFKIDFSGIVRFNYWLISLALIIFTFRESSNMY